MNCLHPPFDDVRIRRAVRLSVAQDEYMRASRGDDRRLAGLPQLWPRGTADYHERARS